jgi:large subunit ribosomal protein L10
MPNAKNQTQIADISEKLTKAKNVVFTSYAGLSVADQVTLRAKIKLAGGELNVVKNTLVRRALADRLKTNEQSTLKQALQGPTAVVYGYEDVVTPTKALVEFAKEHEVMAMKLGVMFDEDGKAESVMTADQVIALSKLPGKQELLAQLVGQLNAPITGFVNVLQGNIRNLVYALEAVRKQKEAAPTN